jgi:hypothetical protein
MCGAKRIIRVDMNPDKLEIGMLSVGNASLIIPKRCLSFTLHRAPGVHIAEVSETGSR